MVSLSWRGTRPASSPSVEEALRAAAARFALLADVLELQALGIEPNAPTSPWARKALKRWRKRANRPSGTWSDS